MLYSEMATEIRERLGESSADFWSDAYLQNQLLRGVMRFCHEERWTWLQCLQTNVQINAGSSEFELVDDVDATRHFAIVMKPSGDTDDRRLVVPKKVSPSRGFELRMRYTISGAPLYYYVAKVQYNEYGSGDKYAVAVMCHLVPTPDVTYIAEYMYYRNPVTGVAFDGATEPIVPEPYQEAIVAWATGMAWLKELNGGMKAQEQFNLYNAVLSQARQDEQRLADDEHLVWGVVQPQGPEPSDIHSWVTQHIPTVLGS